MGSFIAVYTIKTADGLLSAFQEHRSMWPFPSFSGFKFQRDEHFYSDTNWAKTPSYQRTRPLGTSTDNIIALSIGSAERSFELYLTPTRFAQLEGMINTKGLLTDWGRPIPDSRQAFLTEVAPSQDVYSYKPTGIVGRKIPTKLTFITA